MWNKSEEERKIPDTFSNKHYRKEKDNEINIIQYKPLKMKLLWQGLDINWKGPMESSGIL